MRARAPAVLPPAPLACTTCGSPEWVAVCPGHESSPDARDTVVALHPPPARPMQIYCSAHWPWWPTASSPRIAIQDRADG